MRCQIPPHLSGSAALDLCLIAAGHSDAYFQCGIHCWDIAAGALIVSEAGGFVYDLDGDEFDIMSRRVMAAATPKLANELVDCKLEHLEYEREHQEACYL